MSSLWGSEFISVDDSKSKSVINRVNNIDKKIDLRKTFSNLDSTLESIDREVKRILGGYASQTIVLKSREQFHNYIQSALNNKIIAIDTETNNSLDPITCKIMGLCLYTPGQLNAYIPINHVNPYTGHRLDWQCTENDIREELSFINNSDTDTIYHNAKFDIEVIKCTCDIDMKVSWDTFIGAKLLDENELAGLKHQYITKIDNSIEKYDIEHLFKDIQYSYVSPELFALYAATDSYMTLKLYEWQKKQFEKSENKKMYKLFREIEMPLVKVLAKMELDGIEVDKDYASKLLSYYNSKLADVDNRINIELQKLKSDIDAWRRTPDATERKQKTDKNGKVSYSKSKSEQLIEPINLSSPTQMAILFYDILKVGIIDKLNPRGTGEDILKRIEHPLSKLILERRGIAILIGTFVEAIPSYAKHDGRVHAHFNQYGAATGRLSSDEPNMQNIPSHAKMLRLMFKATDGYSLVGSDFSQQEPRIMASFSGDDDMLNAYKNKKDLYATIASKIYNNGYWDNMEKNEDGTPNPDGAERRSSTKSLVLGILYGMGSATLAESIKKTPEEAQAIIDSFYKGFPKVKAWIDKTYNTVKKTGYVEDLWGRRRRLPNVSLPDHEIILKNQSKTSQNPLLYIRKDIYSTNPKIKEYEALLKKCKYRNDFKAVQEAAEKEGITIKFNSDKIAEALRQSVNARIQGGAASMSKRAMVNVYNDDILNNLGFRLLICVHDELIGECPQENSEKCAERLSEIMINSSLPECECPMKCDATITSRWYADELSKIIKRSYSKNNDFEQLKKEYCYISEEQLRKVVSDKDFILDF